MKTKGVARVVIAVRDIEKARKFYSELFGISFWDAGIHKDSGTRAMVSWDGGIELVSPISPAPANSTGEGIARLLQDREAALFGVAFKVSDIEEARARAKEKGFRITSEIDRFLPPGFKVFREIFLDPKDTHGISVILIQSERA